MSEFFGDIPPLPQPWSTLEGVSRVVVQDQGIRLPCEGAEVTVHLLTSQLLHVRVVPDGRGKPRRSWAVAQMDEAWPKVVFQVLESSSSLELISDTLRLEIQYHPLRLTFYDLQGQAFAEDAPVSCRWRADQIQANKRLHPEDRLYGLGERTGLLNQRGKICTHWTSDVWGYDNLTDSMYQAIPFVMILRPGLTYGLFLNTTHWSRFDLGSSQTDCLQITSHSRELDYYVIYGPTPAQVLDGYTQITGRMPLPPLWALGYQQCRWSYPSAAAVSNLAQEFRQRQIPCDVIYLDIDYMRGYRVFTWDPLRFPDPAQLIADLKQQGFRVVTIVDPGVKWDPEAGYAVFDQGIADHCFLYKKDGHLLHGYVWPGKTVFPDFMKARVRQWWGNWQQSLTDLGVAGIWNDMNEPALNDRPFGDGGQLVSFPLETPQGEGSDLSDHAETHNLYGLMMARASRESLDHHLGGERGFVLTRSGYAGIQRWSAVWTGDNNSLWEHLEMSLPMLSNLSLSGVSFVGADIGGFGRNASPELFARWMQVGALYPLMRGHSAKHTHPHEPWQFGSEVERICQKFIRLRYQLLPYLYTLFWQARQTGSPIWRPLLYEYPNDPQTYDLSDQVMLGSALLAAPILRPGQTHRAVYLPEGSWFDWWTGEVFFGPTHLLADAPLDQMPLYARAGAVIPLAPPMQHTQERPWDPLTLRVYAGNGDWTYYEDDGHSLGYQSDIWATTPIRVRQEGSLVRVTLYPRQGSWRPDPHRLIVQVVGYGEQQIRDDGSAQTLTFPGQVL
ncbi:MAG: glycoside hydrolase family 31 protein [Cyanobacteriota bacterium]|nr:glycoside hydrolase family 31 protein [Cyanobacteriota bacterium]